MRREALFASRLVCYLLYPVESETVFKGYCCGDGTRSLILSRLGHISCPRSTLFVTWRPGGQVFPVAVSVATAVTTATLPTRLRLLPSGNPSLVTTLDGVVLILWR